MRKPSRLMPKYVQKRPGILGWLCMALLFAPLGYSLYRFPITVGIIFAIVVCFVIPLNRNYKARLRAIAALRSGDSICTFARSFDAHEVDTWVIRAVYEQLQSYLASDFTEFPIRPEDNLTENLLLDQEDLDFDLAQEIAQRTGRSLADSKSNPFYGKVQTVRDLVLFFNSQPVIRQT